MLSGLLPGRKRAQLATSSLVGSSRRRCLSSSGAVTSRAWSWFAAWVRAFTAECQADSEGPDHLYPSVPTLGFSDCLAGQHCPGCDFCVNGIGLALATPVTALGSLDFHHRDSRRLQVARKPSSVAAGPLYSDTPHGAKALRPTKESHVASRGGRCC